MHIGSGKKPWSYIKPPDWWKYENSKINPNIIDDRCFQHTLKLTQHNKEIKYHPEHVLSIKLFIELYNWNSI